MLPTLAPGDHVLVDPRAYARHPPEADDVVVARHPYVRAQLLIKRVERVDADEVWLASDCPDEGTDSRSFGPVRVDALVGRVTSKVPG